MRRIVICDSEAAARKSLKNSLNELGFDEIVECGDGEAAVKNTLAVLPDIVILDVALPKKDGITAAEEVRQKLKIPIMLLTAAADAAVVARAKNAGIAAILVKPLRESELWPAIELAVAHHHEVEQLKEQVEDLKESLESRKVIEKAKGVLMRNLGLTEPEAFRKMQKLAMDKRKSLRQISEAILLTE